LSRYFDTTSGSAYQLNARFTTFRLGPSNLASPTSATLATSPPRNNKPQCALESYHCPAVSKQPLYRYATDHVYIQQRRSPSLQHTDQPTTLEGRALSSISPTIRLSHFFLFFLPFFPFSLIPSPVNVLGRYPQVLTRTFHLHEELVVCPRVAFTFYPLLRPGYGHPVIAIRNLQFAFYRRDSFAHFSSPTEGTIPCVRFADWPPFCLQYT